MRFSPNSAEHRLDIRGVCCCCFARPNIGRCPVHLRQPEDNVFLTDTGRAPTELRPMWDRALESIVPVADRCKGHQPMLGRNSTELCGGRLWSRQRARPRVPSWESHTGWKGVCVGFTLAPTSVFLFCGPSVTPSWRLIVLPPGPCCTGTLLEPVRVRAVPFVVFSLHHSD